MQPPDELLGHRIGELNATLNYGLPFSLDRGCVVSGLIPSNSRFGTGSRAARLKPELQTARNSDGCGSEFRLQAVRGHNENCCRLAWPAGLGLMVAVGFIFLGRTAINL